MNFDEILQTIESAYFTTAIGVVSTPAQFHRAIGNDPTVRALLGQLEHPEKRRVLFARVADMLKAAADPQYAHPLDIPIAIYIRALDITEPDLARMLAFAARRLTNLWWARDVIDLVSEQTSTPSTAETTVHFAAGGAVGETVVRTLAALRSTGSPHLLVWLHTVQAASTRSHSTDSRTSQEID